MRGQSLLEAMDYVAERYVAEAEQPKRHRGKWGIVAACLCLLACGVFLLPKTGGRAVISVEAAELSQAELQLGATAPSFLYADQSRIIMYDYIGIWVYDRQAKGITGFCDFRPLNMTQIQGEPCVFAEATENGQYAKFYWSDGSECYLYSVQDDRYEKVKNYDTSVKKSFIMPYAESSEESLSDYAPTCYTKEGQRISYTFTFDDSEPLRYGDMVLLIEEKNGEASAVNMFGN